MSLDIIAQIENFLGKNPQERVTCEQFLQFINAFEQAAFERSNLTGHLTASAWILCKETKKSALLVHHAKLDKWLQPGGHADGDTNLSRVATKEVSEETGLDIQPASEEIFDLDVHAIPVRGDVPVHLHFDVRYLFLASQSLPLTISHESRDVRWFQKEEILKLGVDSSVQRMLTRSLQCAD